MTQTKVTDAMRDTTSLDVSDLSGAVPVAKGGTGVTAVGTSGNVLTSNGSAWASTAPAGGGAWNVVSSGTLSAQILEVTGISTNTRIIFQATGPTNVGGTIRIRTSTDNGASYTSSTAAYFYTQMYWNESGTVAGSNNTGTYLQVGTAGGVVVIDISMPDSSSYNTVFQTYSGYCLATNSASGYMNIGMRDNAEVNNAIQTTTNLTGKYSVQTLNI